MNEINLILYMLIAIFVFFIIQRRLREGFAIPTNGERPFVDTFDDKGNQLPIVLLSHPFTRDSSYEQYKKYKEDNFLILGISSYNEFPKITTNTHDVLNNPNEKAWKNYDYMKVVSGWLHCFRQPDRFIDRGIPRALISESDFTDTVTFCPDKSVQKKYDFLYICPRDADKNCDGWVSTNKNWKLGKECVEILCRDFNMRGLLVGRKGCPLPEHAAKNCETTDFLSRDQLIRCYRMSKAILIPNQSDASPRVLTEALCCDVPALVNRNILGGWKYINGQTGVFFDSSKDFPDKVRKFQQNYFLFQPRNYFLNNYGKVNSGKRFRKFIKNNFKDKVDLSNTKYITL